MRLIAFYSDRYVVHTYVWNRKSCFVYFSCTQILPTGPNHLHTTSALHTSLEPRELCMYIWNSKTTQMSFISLDKTKDQHPDHITTLGTNQFYSSKASRHQFCKTEISTLLNEQNPELYQVREKLNNRAAPTYVQAYECLTSVPIDRSWKNAHLNVKDVYRYCHAFARSVFVSYSN